MQPGIIAGDEVKYQFLNMSSLRLNFYMLRSQIFPSFCDVAGPCYFDFFFFLFFFLVPGFWLLSECPWTSSPPPPTPDLCFHEVFVCMNVSSVGPWLLNSVMWSYASFILLVCVCVFLSPCLTLPLAFAHSHARLEAHAECEAHTHTHTEAHGPLRTHTATRSHSHSMHCELRLTPLHKSV